MPTENCVNSSYKRFVKYIYKYLSHNIEIHTLITKSHWLSLFVLHYVCIITNLFVILTQNITELLGYIVMWGISFCEGNNFTFSEHPILWVLGYVKTTNLLQLIM